MRIAAFIFVVLLAGATHAQTTSLDSADQERLNAALASPARPLEHRLRDEQRNPGRIIAQMHLAPGDTVLDVGAGGGYLALIAATLVGEQGRVDIHNTPGWIAQFPSMDPEAMARRITQPNVGYITAPWHHLEAPPESYDAIVMGQVYHDAILEGADIEVMTRNLHTMLKPGGVLVIEDHDADPTMSVGEQVGLHRIAPAVVTEHMRLAGLDRLAIIPLASEHDDFRFNVFRPGIRGRTSRYILEFRKPD